MKLYFPLLAVFAVCSATRGDTAYGSLSNFDVVNDTSQKCYGFQIELDDIHSTDVTYTYDWNHYGTPRITEDSSDPAHPKVFVMYEAKKNSDGSFAAFTNPQDPANPIGPTGGHACTDPSVNLGCEHFGVGLYKVPSLITYHWAIEDPQGQGSIIVGPAVTISAPVFAYVPAVPPPVNPGDPPAAPAHVIAVIEPPEPPEPVPGQFGVPVWVKVLKTVQPAGKKIRLDELVTDDETDPADPHWDGGENPETEVEWMVFQQRPPDDPEVAEFEAQDDLPNGDEAVTRRYEFYEYLGPVNAEDGEVQCDNPDSCPGAVGAYIGSQMAGFNVEAPLGLIDHLQDGQLLQPYVDRTVVVGGNTPYSVRLSNGVLPDGLVLDGVTGILSGTPQAEGSFLFTVEATDADAVVVTKEYTLQIEAILTVTTTALPDGAEGADYMVTLTADGGVPPLLWEADGLPAGLALSPDGVLTGTPEAGSAGDYAPVFTVTDSLGTSDSIGIPMTISGPAVVPGDVDGDSDVDSADLALVLAARNKPASGPADPRDLDKDGRITVLDARILVTRMARP